MLLCLTVYGLENKVQSFWVFPKGMETRPQFLQWTSSMAVKGDFGFPDCQVQTG